ncbi:MAG: hypothetical protein Q7T72_09955 [Bacteroidales bacterium]|nr:hypothetical protein [Bacteroidales bacterium]MDP3001706.1 hypothetical protein [Bacteroidales bacterium]
MNEAIKNLSNEEIVGFEWIKSKPEVSTKEYAEHFGFTQRTDSRHLSTLLNAGLLTTNDENLKSPKLRYSAGNYKT